MTDITNVDLITKPDKIKPPLNVNPTSTKPMQLLDLQNSIKPKSTTHKCSRIKVLVALYSTIHSTCHHHIDIGSSSLTLTMSTTRSIRHISLNDASNIINLKEHKHTHTHTQKHKMQSRKLCSPQVFILYDCI